MSSEAEDKPSLESLLIAHRDTLGRIVRRRGSGLLRYESVEDLVQGVHLQAFKAAHWFDYRGEKAFLGWLTRVAQQHIAKRNEYWRAGKRDAGHMLRITASDRKSQAAGTRGVSPAAPATGPFTLASRREQPGIRG